MVVGIKIPVAVLLVALRSAEPTTQAAGDGGTGVLVATLTRTPTSTAMRTRIAVPGPAFSTLSVWPDNKTMPPRRTT